MWEDARTQEAERGNDEAILVPLDGVFAPPPICRFASGEKDCSSVVCVSIACSLRCAR